MQFGVQVQHLEEKQRTAAAGAAADLALREGLQSQLDLAESAVMSHKAAAADARRERDATEARAAALEEAHLRELSNCRAAVGPFWVYLTWFRALTAREQHGLYPSLNLGSRASGSLTLSSVTP